MPHSTRYLMVWRYYIRSISIFPTKKKQFFIIYIAQRFETVLLFLQVNCWERVWIWIQSAAIDVFFFLSLHRIGSTMLLFPYNNKSQFGMELVDINLICSFVTFWVCKKFSVLSISYSPIQWLMRMKCVFPRKCPKKNRVKISIFMCATFLVKTLFCRLIWLYIDGIYWKLRLLYCILSHFVYESTNRKWKRNFMSYWQMANGSMPVPIKITYCPLDYYYYFIKNVVFPSFFLAHFF